MKLLGIFFFLLFTSFVILPQDTLRQNPKHIIDTSIVKNSFGGELKIKNTSTNTFTSFLLQIIPYIIALAGIIISAFALYNQRTITQKQINAETKRKFINDMIEQSKSISKLVFALFEITNDFLVSKNQCDDIFDIVDKNKERAAENPVLQNQLLSASRYQMQKVENTFDQIFKISKEFYHNVGSIFLYLPRNHKEYEALKTLSKQLENSFSDYINCFELKDTTNEHKLEKTKIDEIGDILSDNLSKLADKIQDIIDEQRVLLENVFNENANK
jgi:hypothetical protein